MPYPLPDNESDRLQTLHLLNILDTPAEIEFDDLTELAAQICETPIALITLIDDDRQWFKSKVGISVPETPRDMAVCAYTILENEILIVPDATQDERFANNPLVANAPYLRSYMGVPIITDDGHALGTICVIDNKPRHLRVEQQECLKKLARQVKTLFALKHKTNQLEQSNHWLTDSQKNYHFMAEAIPQQVWTAVPDGNLDYTNQRVFDYFGLSADDQLLGWSWVDVLHPKDVEPCIKKWTHSLETGEPYEVEFRLRRHDGTYRWHLAQALAMRDQDGKIVKWFGSNTDIHDYKKAEASAHKSQEYRNLFQHANDAIVIFDQKTNVILDINDKACELYGFTHEEFIGKSISEISHNTLQDITAYSNSGANKEHHTFEAVQYRADGKPLHLLISSSVIEYQGYTAVLSNNRDISYLKQNEAALRDSEYKLRTLIESMSEGLLHVDDKGRIQFANNRFCEMVGYTQDELLGKVDVELFFDQKSRNFLKKANSRRRQGISESYEIQIRRKCDDLLWVSVAAAPIVDVEGQITGSMSIITDITERRQTEEDLRESRQILQTVLNTIPNAVFWKDRDLNFLGCNRYMAKLLGLRNPAEIIGKTDADFAWKNNETDSYDSYEKSVVDTGTPIFHITETHTLRDGSTVWLDTNRVALRDSRGKVIGLLCTFQDITEQKRSQENLLHNALHDALTGLPNRSLFLEYLRHTIERHVREPHSLYAVLFLDFDRFKVINDSLGHMAGDTLLKLIAQRLKNSLRSSDIVARFGGDEFTILLDDLGSIKDVILVVERIQEEIKGSFNLNGHEVFTSASIGIAVKDRRYRNPEELLRDADIAMFRAKASGKASYQIFSQAMHEQANKRLQMETELRQAVTRNEFCVYYQPIVNLHDKRIVGFESLVRWVHPRHGLIPPNDFISIAEETGLIVPLGEFVLNESCQQLRRWQEDNPLYKNLTISVNLSYRQFSQDDLVEHIDTILNRTGIKARNLRLEVTESHFIGDSEKAIKIMSELSALGIMLSIDDFGTGYSSLSYLHRLPIDFLKIDRSFISNMQTHAESDEIVRTVIMLAKNLDIEVIAEGIETDKQSEYLKSLNCNFGQGYFFSRPVDAENAEKLISLQLVSSV